MVEGKVKKDRLLRELELLLAWVRSRAVAPGGNLFPQDLEELRLRLLSILAHFG